MKYDCLRVLPMSSEDIQPFDESETHSQAQKTLLQLLKLKNENRNRGSYFYQSEKIAFEAEKNIKNILVLFQFKNKIIACANLLDKNKEKKFFTFDHLKIFTPIENDIFYQIFNRKLSQASHKLEINKQNDEFLELIESQNDFCKHKIL